MGATSALGRGLPPAVGGEVDSAVGKISSLLPESPLAAERCGTASDYVHFPSDAVGHIPDLFGSEGPLSKFEVTLNYCYVRDINGTHITSASGTPSGNPGLGMRYDGATQEYLDDDGACAGVAYVGHFTDTSDSTSTWDPYLSVNKCP